MLGRKIGFAAFFSMVLCFNAMAQEATQKKDLSNGNVAEQLDYVESESNNFQEYKVIKKTWYNTLQRNINDSVVALETQIKALQKSVMETKALMQKNQQDLLATQDSLVEVRAVQSNMKWIGIPMEKALYRAVMWSIITLFTLLWLVFVFRFNAANRKTKQAKQDLEELREEFEEHRKAALLREQKARRELQDEINLRRKREGGNA